MPDHIYYEQLAALAAGGHLTEPEREELRVHVGVCPECRESVRAYRDIVISGLPLTRDAGSAGREMVTAAPAAEARERFLTRARSEGVSFSPDLDAQGTPARWFS